MAPHLVLAEVASVLRRAEQEGRISDVSATMAHTDLVDLPIGPLPYEPFSKRIWELRTKLTPYDARCVAIAEYYDVPLATLDRKLLSTRGPACQFLTVEADVPLRGARPIEELPDDTGA